ncbi:MAG: ribosomal small subunit methyltransferase [Myxococcaceae bacterium]|nr:ribosomal small subunit methyltransferase [Myxococcaceae bacterium]
MRIVAGTVRGRTLKAPRRADVIRPTADRVRESIFNVLGQTCEGLTVLDLFAGTGALAFEALSRGATKAVLVDSGREAQQLCRENAQALGFTPVVEVLPLPAERAVAKLSVRGDRFELIFADPPYAQTAVDHLLAWLTAHPLLTEGGRLVLEHSKHETAPEAAGAFTRLDQRVFGETVVSIFGSAR